MTRTTLSLALALAGALALTAAPARADTYELTVGSSMRHMPSSSIDAIAEDDTNTMFSLGGAIKLNRVSIPGFQLLLDGSFEAGSHSGTTFERMTSETTILSWMLGARIRRDMGPRSAVFARALIGLGRVSLALTDSLDAAGRISDRGWSASSYLGAGLEYLPVRARNTDGTDRFALGLRAEVGYAAMSAVEMRAVPENEDLPEGAIKVPTQPVSMGSLNVSAWTFRVGVVTRF